MTQNQIRYQEFLEARRHNAATEAEILRHNAVSEEQTVSSLGIAARQAAAANTSAGAAYLNALTNQYNAETTRDKVKSDAYARGIELGYKDREIKIEEEKLKHGSFGERVKAFLEGAGTALGFLTAH